MRAAEATMDHMGEIPLEVAYRRVRDKILYSTLLHELRNGTNIWPSNEAVDPGVPSVAVSLNALLFKFANICTSPALSQQIVHSGEICGDESASARPSRRISSYSYSDSHDWSSMGTASNVDNNGKSENNVLARFQVFQGIVSDLQQLIESSATVTISKNKKLMLINELEICRSIVSAAQESIASNGQSRSISHVPASILPSAPTPNSASPAPSRVSSNSQSAHSSSPHPSQPAILFEKIFEDFLRETQDGSTTNGCDKLLNSLYDNGKNHGAKLFPSLGVRSLNPPLKTAKAVRSNNYKDYIKLYKGVTFSNENITAMIEYHGKQVFLGPFECPEDAARAHDRCLIRTIGPINCDGECLNFPLAEYARDHITLFSQYDFELKKYLFGTGWSGPKGCDFSFLVTKGVLPKLSPSNIELGCSNRERKRSIQFHGLDDSIEDFDYCKARSSISPQYRRNEMLTCSSGRRVEIRQPYDLEHARGSEKQRAASCGTDLIGTFLYTKMAGWHQIRLNDNSILSIRGLFVNGFTDANHNTFQLKLARIDGEDLDTIASINHHQVPHNTPKNSDSSTNKRSRNAGPGRPPDSTKVRDMTQAAVKKKRVEKVQKVEHFYYFLKLTLNSKVRVTLSESPYFNQVGTIVKTPEGKDTWFQVQFGKSIAKFRTTALVLVDVNNHDIELNEENICIGSNAVSDTDDDNEDNLDNEGNNNNDDNNSDSGSDSGSDDSSDDDSEVLVEDGFSSNTTEKSSECEINVLNGTNANNGDNVVLAAVEDRN